MKKLIIFILIILPLNVHGEIITGEVKFTQEITEAPAAQNVNKPLGFEHIRKNLIDKNNYENLEYLSLGVTETKDKKLAKFSDGTYGVMYFDDPLYSWYYTSNGRLVNFTQRSSENYPCKITKYKPDGSVVNTGYKVSNTESYIYNLDGRLIAHWIDNLCYDGNNNLVMTRKNIE